MPTNRLSYRDSETGEVHSGALLMNAGLNLTCRPNEDGSSFTIHVIEEK
ncbi:MAG: GH36 C-terminal domain-containing protein [Lachnospiraceae bacterium]|nr:GH36 C-terminal domain-containing protein [Lachnospiraceae bacterium]